MSNQPVESFKVAATIPAYRIVAVSAENTVALGTAASDALIGVTKNTVNDINEAIPVVTHGRVPLLFNDTVSAGALVTTDAQGRGVPFVAVTAATSFIGRLVGGAVSATGTIAEVYVNPGLA